LTSMHSGSVTIWIELFKQAMPSPPNVCGAVLRRLVGLARQRLGASAAVIDARTSPSAFSTASTWRRSRSLPRLSDRGDLWQILVMLTAARSGGASAMNSATNAIGASRAHLMPEEQGSVEIIGRERPRNSQRRSRGVQATARLLGDETLRSWQSGRWKGTPSRRSLLG